MSIQVSKKQEKSELILNISVPYEDYKKYIEKSAENFSKNVEIKGFRKGTAPYDIVAKHVGEMNIYENALEEIINNSYYEAIKEIEENVKFFVEPEITIEKMAPNNPIEYIAKLMLVPEIQLGKYKNLNYKIKNTYKEEEIKDKAKKSINELLEMRSKESVQDKAIESGDKATMNLELSQNGVILEDGQIRDFNSICEEKKFIPGFFKNIEGMKAGETKNFELEFPKDYFESKLAGKKVNFKCEVKTVYKREIPELNDDFVKTLGNFKNKEEFIKQIEENISQEGLEKGKEKTTLDLLEEIKKKSKISEIPQRLINFEAKKMIEELKNSVAQSGMDWNSYKDSIKKQEEELEKEFEGKAKERVISSLILEKIGEEEKIKVDPEEIQNEIEQTKKVYATHPDYETIEKNLDDPRYISNLERIMKNRKTIEFLQKENISNL
ncbi:trigger factor [bacterium]|nr:trigger factor [bacterium]